MTSPADRIARLSPEKRALLLQRLRGTGSGLNPPTLTCRPNTAEYPLSFAQQRLWFLNQLEPDSPFYNIVAALRLTGPLDAGALQHALNAILRRHEVLRARFVTERGYPVQVIAPELTLSLARVDLRDEPPERREAEALRLIEAEVRRPFDLAQGPLLRAGLVQTEDNVHLIWLALHHIVSDGWSIRVLIQELAVLYPAYARGETAALPELPIQYADFAHWQRAQLAGKGGSSPGATTCETQLAYWREQLTDLPPVLDLPTDHPRPPAQTFNGARQSVSISTALADQLRALGRKESATLFMTLLAAYQVLLACYSGQDDFAVGIPVANRRQHETQGLIGLFVNTLVMRAQFTPDTTFRTHLRQTREAVLGGYTHQDLPFEFLLEALGLSPDLSHSPLIQVMFTLHDSPLAGLNAGELALDLLEPDTRTAKFDLTLIVEEQADGLKATFEYNTDLFEAASIRRMLGHYATLLAGAVAAPDTPISRLPLLTAAEREQVLVEWNQTERAIPEVGGVHELFEGWAARQPGATALVMGERRLSYGELNERAEALAQRLRAAGVGRETVVGVYLERSFEQITGVLGIWKAGGAYLPLDVHYPAERLAYMLGDSGTRLIVTQEARASEVRGLAPGVEMIVLDGESGWAVGEARGETRRAEPTARALAYVIYTSGSTGQPKGALLEHVGLINLAAAQGAEFGMGPGTRVLQFAPLSFDASVWEIVMALGNGGELVLAEQEALVGELERVLREQRVNVVTLPPSVLRVLSGERLAELHTVISAGEACPREIVERWGRGRRFYNAYGPTETTVCATWGECAAGERVSIGRAIANVQVYVLDEQRQPVPVGVAGELYIGGVGVGRGYLKRAALTAERFVKVEGVQPSAQREGPTRIYKTGDRVRWLGDGRLEYLGRLDEQVKVRGYRIEPGEIEAALRRHPGVREAVVVAQGESLHDKSLVAYLVADPTPTPEELREFLKSRLASYMVPAAFVTVSELPLTPSGKVNKRGLPAPQFASSHGARPFLAPRTPLEQVLADIWQDVLRLPRVGAYDHFFELGGDSLRAAVVMNRLREVLGVTTPVRSLFAAPTLAELALYLAEHCPEAVSALTASASLPPDGRPQPTPGEPPAERSCNAAAESCGLSFAQQRLWFLDRLIPGSPLYNMPAALRLTGPLDVGALQRALEEIVRRHEILRTTFRTIDGQPRLHVGSSLAFYLEAVDLSTEPDSMATVQTHLQVEARRPFDLSVGPLWRVRLYRIGPAEHIIFLNFHHIICDGWSLGVFVREIAQLYEAARAGGTPGAVLPPLPCQYFDFARWQREWLQGDVLEKQLAYWKKQLADLPPVLELPTDRPRPAVQTYNGATERLDLPASLLEKLYALSREAGVTLFMTLLAAYQVLLGRYSGQEDFAVGTAIANRQRAEFEPLIGMFVNTLVLRADLTGAPSFRELLRRVRETALGAYAHQDLPFERIVDVLQPERDLSRSPLFQVMFSLQNTPFPGMDLPGLSIQPLLVDDQTAKFDLSLFVVERDGNFTATFEYNTDLFEAASIRRMLGHYATLLAGAVAAPDTPISRLPLLTAAEREQVLVEWNQTERAIPEVGGVHELFEGWAARQPGATALVMGERRLSYGELNERAEALAQRLRAAGVGRETVVGVYLERSFEQITGVLGIWKAGGAYLPLDVHYPAERLAYMLGDSGTRLIVTQEARASEVRGLAPGVEMIVLDGESGWAVGEARGETRRAEPTARALAYVIYTSGSTGQPKGALLEHVGLINLAAAQGAEFGMGPGTRVLQFAPLSFDASVWEIVMALGNGGELVLAEQEALVGELERVLREQRVNVVTLPPSVLRVLSGERLAELHTVISAGEACPREIVERWGRGRRFYNAYGPTETTVCATWGECAAGERVSIGRAIANVQVYVLDEQRQPVPVGVAGELYIGGVGVGRGYLKRAALTAERFLISDFRFLIADLALQSEIRNLKSKIYKTGDRVRWLRDGRLEYLGRLDEQVKVRGYRIEPGEIEAALRRHPGVREAVVMAREDVGGGGERRLVAYVELAGVRQADEPTGEGASALAATGVVGELREHLRRQLPEYLVPGHIVLVERFPLTPSGKVDRKRLPAPEIEQVAATEYVAPRTPAEQKLAEIWLQVLGLPRVSVRDNFFQLGGDSILSIQVIARAAQVGLRLTPRQFFQHPTIEALVAAAAHGSAINVEQGPVIGPTPLSPIQRWFFEGDWPQPAHWNQAFLLEVREPLDVGALHGAIAALLEHHDALRLRFTHTVEGWQAEFAPHAAQTPVEVVDLSAEPDATLTTAIEARCAVAQASLDLSAGPLLRVVYFDCGPGRSGRLLLVAHHLVVDGVSWRVLFEDLQTAYRQLQAGQAVALPAKTTSFKVWAERLITEAESEATLAELAYWQTQGLPGPLPVDDCLGPNTEASTQSVRITFTETETQVLSKDLLAAYGADIKDALLMALTQALNEWTGSDTAWITLEDHGREALFEDVDVTRTVGWFTSLYPVRLDLNHAQSDPGKALKTIKEQLRQVPRHGLGYGLLRFISGRLPQNALPEISFNYLGQFDQVLNTTAGFTLARETPGPSRNLAGKRADIISVIASLTHGRLHLEWDYSQNLHRRETVDWLIDRFIGALRALMAHCQKVNLAEYTPSDFPEVGLNTVELDLLLEELGQE